MTRNTSRRMPAKEKKKREPFVASCNKVYDPLDNNEADIERDMPSYKFGERRLCNYDTPTIVTWRRNSGWGERKVGGFESKRTHQRAFPPSSGGPLKRRRQARD